MSPATVQYDSIISAVEVVDHQIKPFSVQCGARNVYFPKEEEAFEYLCSNCSPALQWMQHLQRLQHLKRLQHLQRLPIQPQAQPLQRREQQLQQRSALTT